MSPKINSHIVRVSALVALSVSLLMFCCRPAHSQSHSHSHTQPPGQRKKILTRVFWQDNETQKLSYADIATTDKWHIDRGWVGGFPEVDPATGELGQMRAEGTNVLVGIAGKQDDAGAKRVTIESGVFEQPHGNHFHWMYSKKPNTMNVSPGTLGAPQSPRMPQIANAGEIIGRVLNIDAKELVAGQDYVSDNQWILLAHNADQQPALAMINSGLPQQQGLVKLPISAAEGLKLSNPKTKISMGKRFAFLFQERVDPASDIQEKLVVVELDPNRDMNFSDARVAKVIPVDASKIGSGRGHHNICFDAYGRFAVFTNPGSGLLSVMTLSDMTVRVRFRVGGAPDRIVAVGAPEHFH